MIGVDGAQLGVFSLGEAINMGRSQGVDLVEIAPNATPPVCRLVDYGKFRYEQSKKDKEAKKHHHANKVKEIQLSPTIDPHDFGVKLGHAVDFLCEEMKVKVSLRFRGREMAHKEFGFQTIHKFLKEVAPYAHPDSAPKLIGKGITVMLSPLPRNKRAKNPREQAEGTQRLRTPLEEHRAAAPMHPNSKRPEDGERRSENSLSFANNPFAELDISGGKAKG